MGSVTAGRPEREPAGPGVTIPTSAQRYLPPSVWQQLTCAEVPAGAPAAVPRRGVLLSAQERLRSLLFLVSTYLPAHLVQQKMRRPIAGQVDGRLLSGAFLFSDVSGFTALSEQWAMHADGAERLTTLINAYMTTMLDVLSRSGGVLIKFAGDALLAYFPPEDGGPGHRPGGVVASGVGGAGAEEGAWHQATAQAAARAAVRMMEAMGGLVSHAGAEAGALRIKIGIGTGDCLAAAVGDRERMEYFLLGGAVARMMAAESHAAAGQVVADAATAGLLAGPVGQGMCWQATAVEDGAGYYTLRLVSCPDQEAGSGPGDFDVPVQSRRARGTLPWGASHHAVAAQMEVIVRQIDGLVPFLAPELVDRIVAGAARRRVESEYRPAVVMFVSIAGPEQLLPPADAGPVEAAGAVREATRLLDVYFRTMHRIIADRGGVVARVDPYGGGSKMLVLFGAPVAHEDDAARAVGAALAMNEALVTLDERRQRRAARSRLDEGGGDRRADGAGEAGGRGVRHRIGITCGLTFAGQAGSNTRREYTVMGDDVNLAARLMGAAQWGQILVSRPVRDAVADRFVFTALSPIRVKGKHDEVEIFEARAECADTPPGVAVTGAWCVGRVRELAMGQRLLDAALAGRGGVLAIGGAAGVGKSCLAQALAGHAKERGARTVSVECRGYAAPPYAAWCALLHDLLDVPPRDPVRDNGAVRQRRLLNALDRLGVERADHGPALATLMGVPAMDQAAVGKAASGQEAAGPTLFSRLEKRVEEQERAPNAGAPGGGNGGEATVDVWQLARTRRTAAGSPPGSVAGERMWHRLQERVAASQQARLGEALAEVIQRASTSQPLVLVVDHAQWLDGASRALLELLLNRLAGTDVLLVVAGRLDDGAWLEPIAARSEADAARSEADAARSEVDAARSEAATPAVGVLKLDPLDAAETAHLAQQWLGAEAPEYLAGVDEALAAALYRRSGGNPLFLKELVRVLVRQPDRCAEIVASLDDGLGYFAGLILSRVDALPAGPREAARVAAVAGDVFRQSEVDVLLEPPGVVTTKENAGRSSATHDMLSVLVAGELLSGGENGGDRTYTFQQALVREVIYQSHPFARRRGLHAALAAHLATLPGTEVALLAHHYELAGQLQPAARCFLESARRARARYAYGRAVSDCARALAALVELPDEAKTAAVATLQEALCVEQGDAHLLAGDFAAAATAYGQAVTVREAAAAAEREPGNGEEDSGRAIIPRLSWRLALALAGSGREDEARARVELAWATMDDRAGEPGRPSVCATVDRLAVAATLAWLLARTGERRAPEWIECARSLAGEVEDEWRRDGAARRGTGSGGEIARLVSIVAEMASGDRARNEIPVIFTAVNEVYEAEEDRHGPGSVAERGTI
ncbi:MAG TPA: adenylate/guanylate cyclase domain-containing protein [Anaerolineae bacterium]|nr:adenylate/guanylate cyclase domain-containing protein [Anaerolineae bacterium]